MRYLAIQRFLPLAGILVIPLLAGCPAGGTDAGIDLYEELPGKTLHDPLLIPYYDFGLDGSYVARRKNGTVLGTGTYDIISRTKIVLREDPSDTQVALWEFHDRRSDGTYLITTDNNAVYFESSM